MKYTHGGDIYTTEYRLDFSANICPFGANEAVRQAAIRGMEMVTAYPDSQCRRLRQKLAETLKIPVEWIIAGNGAADVLFFNIFVRNFNVFHYINLRKIQSFASFVLSLIFSVLLKVSSGNYQINFFALSAFNSTYPHFGHT